MGGLYSPGALSFPSSSGHRVFFNTGTHCWLYRPEYPADEEMWNNKDRHSAGLSDHISMASAPLHSQLHSPPRAGHFHHFRGTESSGAGLKNAFSHFEQPIGNLAAQHFWKHRAQLSHSECPRNQQPILTNALGNAGLPRSRKSVAGEVTGSSGSSPLSQPQNFLPPLTITYVGFLNSFFLHSCLNSTGKRKRRLDVEN